MTAKRVMAILAATIMVLCPVAVACSNVDAADGDDAYANAVTAKLKNTTQENYEMIASSGTLSGLLEDLFIKGTGYSSKFDIKMELSEIDWTDGVKYSKDDTWIKGEEIIETDYKFKITITALSNGVALETYDDDKSYLSGEGYDSLKGFITQSLDKDKTIVITGKYSYEAILGSVTNFHKANNGKLLPKDVSMEVAGVTYLTDVKYVANGNELEFGSNFICKVSMKMKEWEYDTAIEKVKENDKCTVSYMNEPTFDQYGKTYSIKYGGSDKSMKFDADKYKKEQSKDPSKYEETVEFTNPGDLDTDVTLKDLSLNSVLKEKSVEDIKATIEGKNGTVSTDTKTFDDEKSSIEKVFATNGKSIPTWVWIAVAAVLALIFIGLLVRTKSKA